MLQTRCGKAYANPAKAGIAFYICAVFRAITVLYEYIYTRKDKPSHTFWMVSCGVISAAIVIKTYLLYNMIIISAVVFHSVLYYLSFLVALVGIGLGVSGIVFFDKDASKGSAGFRSQSSLVTDTDGGSYQAHGSGDGPGVKKE